MKPALRFTRRGPMVFCEADKGAPSGSAANAETAPEKKVVDPAAGKKEDPATTEIDYKAKLLSLLGLDETADAAAIDAKIAEHSTTMGSVGDLTAKAGTADTLQQQLDDISAKYAELNKQQEELWRQKQEADADEILKVYEGHFTDEGSKTAIRNILLTDKDAGIAILNGLKKPEAAAPELVDETKKKETPPGPDHDPNAEATAASAEEKAQKISARAKELVKNSNPKISLTKAYQLAEAELDKPAV